MTDFLQNSERFFELVERVDLDFLIHRFTSDYAAWNSNLSRQQRRTLQAYKGMDYKKINAFMRLGNDCGLNDDDLDHIEMDVETIYSALGTASLPETTTVYRGLKLGYPPKQIRVGNYLEEYGFLSTTLSVETARRISQWTTKVADATILEISVPEGFEAAWIEPLSEKGEYELLLTAPSILHISGITIVQASPVRRYVQCQCVRI